MIRLAEYPWPVTALFFLVAFILLLVISMGLSMLMVEVTMNMPDRRRMRRKQLDRAHEDRAKYRRDLVHEWNADYRRLVEANFPPKPFRVEDHDGHDLVEVQTYGSSTPRTYCTRCPTELD